MVTIKGDMTAWGAKLVGLLLVLAPVYLLLTGNDQVADAKTLWFTWAFGFGLLGLGYFWAERAYVFAILVLSLSLGGAAQLWLLQPLWFPALRFNNDTLNDTAMLAVIGLQGILAVTVIWRRGGLAMLRRVLDGLGVGRLVLIFALSALASVSIMGFVPQGYFTSLGLHLSASAIMIGANMLTVVAMLMLPPPFASYRGFHPVVPALVAFGASAAIAWFAFQGLPHVEDELVYLFQARTLVHGALTVAAPPEVAQPGLAYYLLDIQQGRWFAVTSPGWPAVLALGVLVGAPWLVNPVLAGIAVLLAQAVTQRLAGRKRANIVGLLMCTSPWFIGASGSLMGHTLTITLMLLAWFLLLSNAETLRGHARLAGGAGLAMGWVFFTRQLDGLLLGVLTGLWLLSKWRQPAGALRVLWYSAGALATGSLYFWYNYVMTGDFLQSPLARYLARVWQTGANNYGFGAQIGPPKGWRGLDIAPGHSPYEALINTAQDWSSLQLELFGWGIGSLVLIYALLFWGKLRRTDWAMLAIAITTIAALFFYWFSGSFYIGPRYWFALFFPALYLSASGFDALSERLASLGGDRRTARVTLFVMCLFGLFVFIPWRGVEKYYRFRNFDTEVRQAQNIGLFGNAVVFFDIEANPGSALVLNDPRLPPDQPIFLNAHGEGIDTAVAAAFPNRPAVHFYGARPRF
jgi:hypothetical protein